LYLLFALLLVGFLSYGVLHWMVARPLRQAEETVGQIGRLELNLPFGSSGGPLLSRLQSSLRRMAEALLREQALTKNQLADLKKVNRQLSRAYTELASTERLATVGRLAAGVAHEVGNPLAGIMGYLSLAKQRALGNAELMDFLDRIDAELGRIDQIVRGLLDLGRQKKGALVPTDLANLTETCTRLVSRGPDFERVSIELNVPSGLVATADSGALSQVLINLLLNAAQAMDGGGRVVVRGTREGSRVAVEISDFGPGLSPEVQANLFQPFFTTKPAGKGTGLGLAVSMHLVAEMGGQLSAENAENGGARFTVRLASA
jgi:two-component system, NtrC family, sensor kinase